MIPHEHLIFAFGLERSGTTWMGKILDSHPDTVYKHEPDSLYKLESVPLFADYNDSNKYSEYLSSYIERIPSMKDASICAKLPIFTKSYLNPVSFYIIKFNAILSKIVKKYFSIRLPILQPYSAKFTNKWLVWKSIESVSRLGVISRVFKKSKVVLLIRHPCGFAASLIKGKKHGYMPLSDSGHVDVDFWKNRLTCKIARDYELTLDMIKAMSQIEELAWRWVVDNDQAIYDLSESHNSYILIYDDLCKEPLKQVKSLFEFCGLPWCRETELFVSASTSNEDSKYFSVFKDPNVAANKWRQQLTHDDIKTIHSIVSKSRSYKYFSDSFDNI